MRRSRRRHVPPDLTSLFDVLFIVIFAALIRAAAAEHAAAEAAAPKPQPALKPLDPRSLHARALAQVGTRPSLVVRVSKAGTITALETDADTTPLDVPLLEHSSDPNVALAYLGDRSVELQVCRVAALHAGPGFLVIIAPEVGLADLPEALYEGLERDVERCNGLAVIVDPTEVR
jgi:hypothetical protein